MTSRDFCYWLQGVFEVGQVRTLNEQQVNQIRAHLALVFKHEIDPLIDGGNLEKAKDLQSIHDGAFPENLTMRC